MNDPIWHIGVARIEVMIERHGICNVLGAVLQALENIEREQIQENPDFKNTQHHKNLQYQIQIIEHSMSAVDLDTRYGNSEARKIVIERLIDNLEDMI